MKYAYLVVGLLPFTAAVSDAQVSSATVLVGGPGSTSSEGHSPGLLNDALTAASGALTLHLDADAQLLTAVVTNTSDVITGVNNPLLTKIFFNAPNAVTGMALTGQSSAAGATPDFRLAFDPVPGSNPDPNRGGPFGSFNVGLENTGSVRGSIANADADTFVTAPELLSMGPVTFTIDLAGSLGGLTASDFLATHSVRAGRETMPALFKFQAGGDDEASGAITEGGNCDTPAGTLQLGAPCPSTLTVTPPLQGGVSTAWYDGDSPGGIALFLYSLPGYPYEVLGCEIYLGDPWFIASIAVLDGNGDATVQVSNRSHPCGQDLVAQAFAVGVMGIETSNAVLLTFGD